MRLQTCVPASAVIVLDAAASHFVLCCAIQDSECAEIVQNFHGTTLAQYFRGSLRECVCTNLAHFFDET